LSVANWASRGSIFGSSGRGPTAGGRKKPDIAAPGTSIQSLAFDWDATGVSPHFSQTTNLHPESRAKCGDPSRFSSF
jgi:hypothetical protein